MIAILLALLAVVNVTPNQMTYACNGVAATFAVSYPYLAYTDLVVTSTTSVGSVTTLTNPTNWTINLTSTSTSATLTLTNPAVTCPTGNTLKITRTLQMKQPQSFRGTQVLPDTVERTFDRTEMQIQQIGNLFSNNALGQGGGGTGNNNTLTCSADQFLTSTAPAYSCLTLSVSKNASLTGAGSIASPLGINLANSNSFTVGQTFAASGSGLAAVTITPTTTQPASPLNGNFWLDPTDGLRVRYGGTWHLLGTTSSTDPLANLWGAATGAAAWRTQKIAVVTDKGTTLGLVGVVGGGLGGTAASVWLAGRPTIARTSAATANTSAGWTPTGGAGDCSLNGFDVSLSAANSTGFRGVFTVATDATTSRFLHVTESNKSFGPVLAGHVPPVGSTAAFANKWVGAVYSSAANGGRWIVGSGDGTNESGVDSGVALAASTIYVIDIDCTASSSCRVGINGAYTTKSTNIPDTGASVGLCTENSVTTTVGVAATIYQGSFVLWAP